MSNSKIRQVGRGVEVKVQAAFAGLRESSHHQLQVLLTVSEGLVILAAKAYVSCGKTL